MPNPQQPELRRSEKVVSLSPDAVDGRDAAARPRRRGAEAMGPVPEDNRPGHHPGHEEDKPDLDAFAEKLGIVPPEERHEERGGAAATPAEAPEEVTEPRADRVPEELAGAVTRTNPRRPSVRVLARTGALVVLGPWIAAGRVAERLHTEVERRLARAG